MLNFKIRRAEDRGFTDHGWLKSYHTFSFADYHDPAYMEFRSLRVINEDYVVGGKGFGAHSHQDMEIITYVLEGTLTHKDSMGHQENINAGEIQKMSAGTGVTHSEFNADQEKTVHLFQIWILPDKQGIPPAYQQITLQKSLKNGLLLFASNHENVDSILLQQDAHVYVGRFKEGAEHTYNIKPKRGIWLQMTKGHVLVKGQELFNSDAVGVEDEGALNIKILKRSEFLLFDLA